MRAAIHRDNVNQWKIPGQQKKDVVLIKNIIFVFMHTKIPVDLNFTKKKRISRKTSAIYLQKTEEHSKNIVLSLPKAQENPKKIEILFGYIK